MLSYREHRSKEQIEHISIVQLDHQSYMHIHPQHRHGYAMTWHEFLLHGGSKTHGEPFH